jgi:adenylate cyclase
MADIFISYSSKDRQQALQLVELLTSAGLSVWIDKQGIDLAASWSKEIVQAIDGCKAFVVLLSERAVASHNVIKEVSLASQRRKKILPLDLEPVKLTEELEYHLAGIQRAPATNIDAIIRAINNTGLDATRPTTPATKIDERKSLMILPFEDLSPEGDNGWFADGMTSELISALGNTKALRVIDWNTAKLFKARQVKTTDLARELNVRYFIEGQVRKFGDQIKISATLLDVETSDHLWSESMKGVMEDVFAMQEEVASKVVEGLKIHLTKDEQERVVRRGTDNPEAFEFSLRAQAYTSRHTRADIETALQLFEEATRHDPNFAHAFANVAHSCLQIYNLYGGDPSLLVKAEAAINRIFQIEGKSAQWNWSMSALSRYRGDFEAALMYAQEALKIEPEHSGGIDALAMAYRNLGRLREAADTWEQAIEQDNSDRIVHNNLILVLTHLGDEEGLQKAIERALPVYERYLRLNPDEYHSRTEYANMLIRAGRLAESREVSDQLRAVDTLDGQTLYNLACNYLNLQEPDIGLACLQKAIAKGFQYLEAFKADSDLDPLRGRPEFEALIRKLENKIAKEEKLTTADDRG